MSINKLEPLSDEQIDLICNKLMDEFCWGDDTALIVAKRLARVIERAHGIGVEQERKTLRQIAGLCKPYCSQCSKSTYVIKPEYVDVKEQS